MPLATAFLDPHNDDLFTTIASFSNARALANLDVNDHQKPARDAIFEAIVHALQANPSPGARIALVKGEAGSGKSHVLTTTLRDFVSITEHRQFSVFAAVLQLTAPVTIAEYDVWLLDALIRELSARHFADDAGHSPLRRLAGRLLDYVADQKVQDEFQREIDDLDSDGEIAIALKVGRRIAKEAQVWVREDLSPGFIGAVLLAGFGDASALTYLRHGHVDARAAQLLLTPITTASQRVEVIRNLSSLAQLVRACLVIGFDQVENTVRLGDEGLFMHALTQAVRLVENIPNCAVVIAVLGDEYDHIASGNRSARALAASDFDRIEREAPFPVQLDAGPPEFRRAVVARRLERLRERAQLPAAPGSLAPLPDGLLPFIDASRSIRSALREVSEYRTDAMRRGRLPTWEEFRAGKPIPKTPPPPEVDYAKAWADFKDGGARTTRRLLDATKAELVAWWAQEASREHVTAEPAEVTLTHLKDAERTPLIDIRMQRAGQLIERRQLALCEAPNRNQKLAEQLVRFLEACDGPTPFALRSKGFARSATAQVAPALKALRALGGEAFDLNDTEWDLLARARDFFHIHQAEEGLLAWRRDAQWLRQLAANLLPLISLPELMETPAMEPPAAASSSPPAMEPPPSPRSGAASGSPETASAQPAAGGAGEAGTLTIGRIAAGTLTAERVSAGSDLARPTRGGRRSAPPTPPGEIEPPAATQELAALLAPADGAPFPVLIGHADHGAHQGQAVCWAPYAPPPHHLNNFSMLVTGDAGSGKTQTIRVLIDAASRADLAVTIFDFKADYCSADFAAPLGLQVVDVRTQGLPFNPLQPPPTGASGAQPIEHAREISAILGRVFRLGAVQEGRLKEAVCDAYRMCGIDPHEWVQPEGLSWPGFNRVMELLRDTGENGALVTKLGALEDFRLLGAGGPTPLTASEFFGKRVCLKLSTLPDDETKAALAEILIVQLHGHLLRGEQPRRLTRMLVFDEAHRVKDSRKLETLAREGRAFGVGIVIGTQFPGDMPSEMAGNLATQLFLMNNQAPHRRAIAQQVCGTASTAEAKALLHRLGRLKPLQGLFTNPHYGAVFVNIVPHYKRQAAKESEAQSKSP